LVTFLGETRKVTGRRAAPGEFNLGNDSQIQIEIHPAECASLFRPTNYMLVRKCIVELCEHRLQAGRLRYKGAAI
jgi:hypothetical protein